MRTPRKQWSAGKYIALLVGTLIGIGAIVVGFYALIIFVIVKFIEAIIR